MLVLPTVRDRAPCFRQDSVYIHSRRERGEGGREGGRERGGGGGGGGESYTHVLKATAMGKARAYKSIFTIRGLVISLRHMVPGGFGELILV